MKIEKKEFKPLYLEICGLPWIYSAHHQWLVGQALARRIAGYLCLNDAKYGTSVSIAKQRNDLVKQGLKTDATHFVFVDWDVIPPADAIQRLFRHNKDIIGGVYYSKDEFDRPLVFKNNEDIEAAPAGWRQENYTAYQGKGLEKVNLISAGLSLVRREVYEKMLEIPEIKEEGWYHHQTNKYTEDVYFCQLAERAGYEIWCDFDLIAEHLGVFSNRDIKLKDNKEFINKL